MMTVRRDAAQSKRLDALLADNVDVVSVRGSRRRDISGVAYDSRRVREGNIFVALSGEHCDGANFIRDAVCRGAIAIVSEQAHGACGTATHVRVRNARAALADLADAWCDKPSEKMPVIGITGTNGKTTTSFMVRDILRAAGLLPGLIGTVRYEIGDRRIPATRTTPEAPELQSMLRDMLGAGCRSVVMEVSSHALIQQRVANVDFDVGIFTNLTRDHLDYHKTLESSSQVDVFSYGVDVEADISCVDVKTTRDGTEFMLNTPWGRSRARIGMPGRFNVENALAAIAACGVLGIDLALSIDALANMEPVPGRLERMCCSSGFDVYVDYAHSPDALRNVLQVVREITAGSVIVVFGCGGDRDCAKRALMGAAASELADHAIITTDNPRSEQPADIAEEVLQGCIGNAGVEIVLDREEAIATALAMAQPGSAVVVAGKGHENRQEFANTIVPFSDVETVRRFLANGNRDCDE